MSSEIDRRTFLKSATAASGAALAGCMDSAFDPGIDMGSTGSVAGRPLRPAVGVDANIGSMAKMYAEQQDGPYTLAAIPYSKMEPRFRRQRVVNETGMEPGTVLIDPRNHHAYFVLSRDEAVRYGVGVGKAGFEWSGTAKIGNKKVWPTWTPPAEMIARRPDLVKYASGQPGGPDNPLGARALYLFADGRDTLYRLHGSPEWESIGKSMSSGCIRFLNQDIIDLYNRVPRGTTVRVI